MKQVGNVAYYCKIKNRKIDIGGRLSLIIAGYQGKKEVIGYFYY